MVKDTKGVRRLNRKWKKEYPEAFIDGDYTFKGIRASIKKRQIFIAEDEDNIIGYVKIIVRKRDTPMKRWGLRKRQKFLEVTDMFVKKDYRNKGAGVKLMETAENYARERKIKTIVLSSEGSSGENLISFYHRRGFKINYTRMFKILL